MKFNINIMNNLEISKADSSAIPHNGFAIRHVINHPEIKPVRVNSIEEAQIPEGIRTHFCYTCPGKGLDGEICACEMVLCAVDSIYVKPYFMGRKHKEGCMYKNRLITKRVVELVMNPTQNEIEKCFDDICRPQNRATGCVKNNLHKRNGEGIKNGKDQKEEQGEATFIYQVSERRPIRVNEMYMVLGRLNYKQRLNGSNLCVEDFICDSRTYRGYRFGGNNLIEGSKIVVLTTCKFKTFRESHLSTNEWVAQDAFLPYESCNFYIFKCEDEKVKKNLSSKMLDMANMNKIMILQANDWRFVEVNEDYNGNEHNVYECTVYSKKQFCLINVNDSHENPKNLNLKNN